MAGWTYPVIRTYFIDTHSEIINETDDIRTCISFDYSIMFRAGQGIDMSCSIKRRTLHGNYISIYDY